MKNKMQFGNRPNGLTSEGSKLKRKDKTKRFSARLRVTRAAAREGWSRGINKSASARISKYASQDRKWPQGMGGFGE